VKINSQIKNQPGGIGLAAVKKEFYII